MKYGWILYAAMGGGVTMALHGIVQMPWFLAALVAFVGWPLIGTLITADDDLPSGWSNPDGTQVPEWRTSSFYGRLVLGLAICGIFGVLDQGIGTSAGIAFATGSLLCTGIAILLFRSSSGSKRTERERGC